MAETSCRFPSLSLQIVCCRRSDQEALSLRLVPCCPGGPDLAVVKPQHTIPIGSHDVDGKSLTDAVCILQCASRILAFFFPRQLLPLAPFVNIPHRDHSEGLVKKN